MQTGKVFEFVPTMLPCPAPGHKQCPYITLILQAAQLYIQMEIFKHGRGRTKFLVPSNFLMCTTEFCGEMPMTKLHQGVVFG